MLARKTNRTIVRKPKKPAEIVGPDKDADKTGTDTDSDKTEIPEKGKGTNKFDKPKRETDPDRTGIDTNSDKTKPENSQTKK